MATSVALRRATATPLFAKLTSPVRSVSVFRSFNADSQSQVANTGGKAPGDYGRVELDRRSSSDRSPERTEHRGTERTGGQRERKGKKTDTNEERIHRK